MRDMRFAIISMLIAILLFVLFSKMHRWSMSLIPSSDSPKFILDCDFLHEIHFKFLNLQPLVAGVLSRCQTPIRRMSKKKLFKKLAWLMQHISYEFHLSVGYCGTLNYRGVPVIQKFLCICLVCFIQFWLCLSLLTIPS